MESKLKHRYNVALLRKSHRFQSQDEVHSDS